MKLVKFRVTEKKYGHSKKQVVKEAIEEWTDEQYSSVFGETSYKKYEFIKLNKRKYEKSVI